MSITWEKEGKVYRMRIPITQEQVEIEDKRKGFTPIKGILFGILFSSPFWAAFVYFVCIR